MTDNIMADATPLLEVADIETCYGLSQVLFGVSLSIASGEEITLMGRNGMGKTATVHSIMGLCQPRAGQILFQNQRIDGLLPYQIARIGTHWTAPRLAGTAAQPEFSSPPAMPPVQRVKNIREAIADRAGQARDARQALLK